MVAELTFILKCGKVAAHTYSGLFLPERSQNTVMGNSLTIDRLLYF